MFEQFVILKKNLEKIFNIWHFLKTKKIFWPFEIKIFRKDWENQNQGIAEMRDWAINSNWRTKIAHDLLSAHSLQLRRFLQRHFVSWNWDKTTKTLQQQPFPSKTCAKFQRFFREITAGQIEIKINCHFPDFFTIWRQLKKSGKIKSANEEKLKW